MCVNLSCEYCEEVFAKPYSFLEHQISRPMSNSEMKTILYVDDEEVNLFLFEKIFENEFKVVTASSGSQGLAKMSAHECDVVISDMRMPEMNGLEFVTEARAVFQSAAYFILTGYEFNTDLEKALDTGLIDKIFKKPFDYELIKAASNGLDPVAPKVEK